MKPSGYIWLGAAFFALMTAIGSLVNVVNFLSTKHFGIAIFCAGLGLTALGLCALFIRLAFKIGIDREIRLKREWDEINRRMETIRAKSSDKATVESMSVGEMMADLKVYLQSYRRLVEISKILPDLVINPEYITGVEALKKVLKP
ncbi:MAG: hypothetical protein HYV90_05950 [Candidatus Woesebacteria bacterium]|nr:MAG: hypothetical protein HYV90_05950 [Candidatus Woesebacteria bacterium]